MKKKWKRGAGILLPISSLPSPYGIGTFGKAAYEFVDNLAKAKQTYWQVLPIGPTSYGDSPYQSFSAFAGNPYFIDLDILIEEGLLEKIDVDVDWGSERDFVDYEKIYKQRFLVLKKAYTNSHHKRTKQYEEFQKENEYWLEDYSLYMAVKDSFHGLSWQEWEEDIRFREPNSIKNYQKKYKNEIAFYSFCQYKFYEQWNKLKAYANEKGIKIIGDIPLYVSMDSADVWVHSDLFELDERKKPIHIAGVPPDYFSKTGQRWGNPLYRWDRHEADGFDWWCRRMKANANFYDVIRIDHFIGIVRYYSIPESCPTAMEGEWLLGPGKKLTDAITAKIPKTDLIAEDLGVVVPAVRALQKKTGWPGMKILEFAFDGPENEYLPHHYIDSNCVVYGGTHDNEPLLGYYQGKKRKELQFVYNYLGVKRVKDIPKAIVRAGYASTACLVINQMQDILVLDNKAKMNTPGTLGGNWQWRMLPEQFNDKEIIWLRGLSETFGRCNEKEKSINKQKELGNKSKIKKKITTIILDIGQVLAAFDWLGYLDSMKLSTEKREKMIQATLHDLKHWDEHDRGILTDEEFIQKSLQIVPGIEPELRVFFANIYKMVWEYDYAEQWVLDLKEAGYKVYILSNYGKTTFAYAMEHFKFLKHVDGMVISSDVHYVKPEKDIYQALLDKYQIVPEESVFIDDRADNVEAAVSLGIYGIQFKNKEQAMKELKKLGVQIKK